jgi:hypothetical protein
MRPTRMRLRIAALAGAAALAASLTALSAPAAQAATLHYIQSDYSGYAIASDGAVVVLASVGDDFVVKATEKYDGHTYYEYQDKVTGNCLQANVTDKVVAEGGCAQNARQFWWYDSAKLLVNRYFGTKACAEGKESGASVDLSRGSGLACDWTVGDA